MKRLGNTARRRLAAGALLGVLMCTGVLWWTARTWMPDRARFPVQGLWLDANDAPIDWHLVGARGADFAYLTASMGASQRDSAFAGALEALRKQGMQAGAVHVYDLCAAADAQAANFVTTVPRDPALLPPAIALELDAPTCPQPPGEAAMQSELTTFLNQIEKHVGKAAILMPSRAVENRYHLAAMIDRNLWVAQDFIEPSYVGRPWVMWTASHRLRLDGVPVPVRWIAVQP